MDPTERTSPLPPSFLSCLPALWSQILFPGQGDPDTRPRWRDLLVLLVLPAVLLYPCLSFYLFEPDEGRYAEIPREMLARGDWVVPYLQGEPYLDKPPLLYWLVMGSFALLGAHDWSARLVPALALHLTILATYLIGRRSLGQRPAFLAALLLALAPGFMTMGRLLILDGVLTLFVTTSALCCLEAVRTGRLAWPWWLAGAMACGLGVLCKGPVALVLLLPPLWLHRRLVTDGCHFQWRAWAAFAAVVLAVNLPWYVAACLRMPDFAYHFFWQHNVVRFLDPFDHIRPVWFYLPILLGGLLPGTLLLLPFLRFLLSGTPGDAARRPPALGYFLIVGLWCVLFFSLSGCKLPTYILPAFPALALAFGVFLAGSRWETSRWTGALAGSAFCILALAHYVAVPWYAHYHSPMNRPGEVWDYCGDPGTPVVCYPRNLDSVAFYLGRDDLRSYRSKYTPELLQWLTQKDKAVVLFSHRHSCEQLRNLLPPDYQMVGQRPLGLCKMAIVQRRPAAPIP